MARFWMRKRPKRSKVQLFIQSRPSFGASFGTETAVSVESPRWSARSAAAVTFGRAAVAGAVLAAFVAAGATAPPGPDGAGFGAVTGALAQAASRSDGTTSVRRMMSR